MMASTMINVPYPSTAADAKKHSKVVDRFYKLVSKLGRRSRKLELPPPATPVISVCACEDAAQFPTAPLVIEASATAARFLSIPERDDCLSLDSGLGSAPASPREPVSYPPTPDWQVSNWESDSVPCTGGAFFPHDDGVFLPARAGQAVDVLPREDVDLRDCLLDYGDLEIKAKIQQNATGIIHRGQWHGNVLIYRHSPENSCDEFMVTVKNMSKTRHENILLFLGAAVDNKEQLAIVLQPPKRQQSLHQLLNNPRLNKLPHTLKWNIAHQLAQAVSYLHARDVCVGPALHSGNVFLEAKIKLSLLDFGFFRPADVMFPQFSAATTRNYLTSFLAPELLVLFTVNSSLTGHCTEATDSFAFGSLLYEIFTEEKPFKGLSLHAHLEALKREDFLDLLDRPEIPASVQKIINQCWKWNPAARPTFWEISDLLNSKPAFMLSRRSFSQPDLLDVAGSTDSNSLHTI